MADLNPTPLKEWQAEKFLDRLAREPFMCVVVEKGGEVHLYSCDLDPEHLTRIRDHLKRIMQEEDTDADNQTT